MKKNIIAILACVLIIPLAVSCGKKTKPTAKKSTAPTVKASKNETVKPSEAPVDEVAKRYDDTIKAIKEIEKNWAKADPIDRPNALFAVNVVQVNSVPDVVAQDVNRGNYTGEIITFSVMGAPRDVSAFAQNAETPYSGVTIESIGIKYQMFDIIEASFKAFAPVKILVDPLSPTASKEEKEAALKKAESVLKEAGNLNSENKRSFGFIYELIQRWPFDFPLIDRIVFENDTFTVYPISPLTRADPLLVELGMELSKLAAPSKVNLTPLVSQLIDGREVSVVKNDNQLSFSWNNFRILTIQAADVASYLIDRNRVFALMRDKIADWALRCYNLQDGTIIWEHAFPCERARPTNLFMDPGRRLIVGQSFLLTALDPETGKILKRWFINGLAREVYAGEKGGIAVKSSISAASEYTTEFQNDERISPLPMRAAYWSAALLFSLTKNKLTGECSDGVLDDASKTDADTKYYYRTRANRIMSNLPDLVENDPSNPWIPFFSGVAESFSTGEKSLEKFQTAIGAPVDNPLHYFVLGAKLDALGKTDAADKAYGESFKKFIGWYRPEEITSRLIFDKLVNRMARKRFYSGDAPRAEALIRWSNKFSPYANGTDRFELTSAAWFHKRKNEKLEAEAMLRYERASGKVFGGGIIRDIYFRIAKLGVTLFSVSLLAFIVSMTLKYRETRVRRLSELGYRGIKARLKMIASNRTEWLRHNTSLMMNRWERLALLLLWFLLLTSVSAFLIANQLKRSPIYKATLASDSGNIEWRAFLENSFASKPAPETAYVLGLESQKNADYSKAKSYYSNPVLKSAKRRLASKALNNLGVIAFSEGDAGSAQKYFKGAAEKDAQAPEPRYNLGVVEKKDAFKKRAIEMGLEREYLDYYYDKPVRCGLDDETAATAFTGLGTNIPFETIKRLPETLTGNLAWKYGSGYITILWYVYLLIGVMIVVYQFTPFTFKPDGNDADFEQLNYVLPGFGLIARGKPLLGVLMIVLFVLSILSLYLSMTGINVPHNVFVYPNLSAAEILNHEPLFRKIGIIGWVLLPATIVVNALYAYKLSRSLRGKKE